MKRPYIVCHMMESIDGRIDCDMTEQIESGNEYYDALAQLCCPSLLMGRVTMQMHYASSEEFVAKDKTPIGKTSFFVARKAPGYTIGIDTHGRLRWPANEFDGPLLVITCDDCPKEYLDYLTAQGISWIATGKHSIDLALAMEILYEKFGVERLALTGGGHINAAFLAAGLIDEVSVMITPGIDGRAGMTSVFDGIADADKVPTKLLLRSLTAVGDGVVWLRYGF